VGSRDHRQRPQNGCYTLIADVITLLDGDPTQVAVGLRFTSGASQQLPVTRCRTTVQLCTTDPTAIELARRVGPGMDNAALAAAFNQAGHRHRDRATLR
jgi:hypothetical protein